MRTKKQQKPAASRPQDLRFSAKQLAKAFPKSKTFNVLAAFDAAERDDKESEEK